jgi:antitoxin CcdA
MGKATNLSVDEGPMRDAKRLAIDVSQAAENGILRAIKVEQERLWQIDNANAIVGVNAYVDEHGVPLTKYRQF